MKRSLALCLAALVLAGCGRGTGSPGPGGSGSGSGGALSVTELKLRALDSLPGPLDWCDPDVYPIGRGTPLENARLHYDAMRHNAEVYDAVAEHLGVSTSGRPSDPDLVRIYELYKQVEAITLTPDGDVYRFDLLAQGNGSGSDVRVQGTVDASGNVQTTTSPAPRPNCPICLARGVRIAVPGGTVAVQDIRVGMAVWSVDRSGRRIRATVLRTRRRAADGELLRILLADGRSVLVSPRHPTPTGALAGQLLVGDLLDGVRIASIERVPYRGFTYDLLPSGPTGDYLADGVLLGSTLSR